MPFGSKQQQQELPFPAKLRDTPEQTTETLEDDDTGPRSLEDADITDLQEFQRLLEELLSRMLPLAAAQGEEFEVGPENIGGEVAEPSGPDFSLPGNLSELEVEQEMMEGPPTDPSADPLAHLFQQKGNLSEVEKEKDQLPFSEITPRMQGRTRKRRPPQG
jgi:hypothetical protein